METGIKAWFKIDNFETPWSMVSLNGIEYVDQLKTAIRNISDKTLEHYDAFHLTIKVKIDDNKDNVRVLDPEEKISSILKLFGNRVIRFHVSVPSGK